MLECVVNISEGRRAGVIEAVARGAGADLLDVHLDRDHNRSVLTIAGAEAVRPVAIAAVRDLDLRSHEGVHPRLGVVDVVPFVPLGSATIDDAIEARDAFALWLADEAGVPCFGYGPPSPLSPRGLTLPEVRKGAFTSIDPDTGPEEPHATAGACAVGARPVLVAYNLWLAVADIVLAREIAREVRGPAVRALGFSVGDQVQVSMNLLDAAVTGPAEVFDAVAARAPVARAELVGLIPAGVLDSTPRERWEELDLAPSKTIEARLEARGLLLY